MTSRSESTTQSERNESSELRSREFDSEETLEVRIRLPFVNSKLREHDLRLHRLSVRVVSFCIDENRTIVVKGSGLKALSPSCLGIP